MLAVAIRAEGSLRHAFSKRLAVDAGAVLLNYVAVAHVARVGHGHAEALGFRT